MIIVLKCTVSISVPHLQLLYVLVRGNIPLSIWTTIEKFSKLHHLVYVVGRYMYITTYVCMFRLFCYVKRNAKVTIIVAEWLYNVYFIHFFISLPIFQFLQQSNEMFFPTYFSREYHLDVLLVDSNDLSNKETCR